MRILISFFPHSLSKILENARPMIAVCGGEACVENLDGVGGGAEREKGRRSTKSYVSLVATRK